MAEQLRRGAKMLSISCPECGLPLLQQKSGEIFCTYCRREVKILKDGEKPESIELADNIDAVINKKIRLIQDKLETEDNPTNIKLLAETLISLLDVQKRLAIKKG